MRKNIIDHIQENPSSFQANFQLMERKTREYKEKYLKNIRMINHPQYQTNEYLIDRFYKKISRTFL